MANDLMFGLDAKTKVFNGIEKISKAVMTSLGPRADVAIIQTPMGSPLITKDGVSIAKAITLEDPYENLGASLIKDISSKSNNVGDGTTTSTVLGYAMAKEGMKALSSGVFGSELRKGMKRATDMAVKAIRDKSVEIRNSDDIKNVATIASNNDKEIGKLVAEAFEKVGENGLITVDESQTTETHIDFEEGMQFDRGWVSPYLVTDAEKMIWEMKDVYVLVTDESVTNIQKVAPLLQKIAQTGKPCLMIGSDFGGEVLPTLVLNKMKGALNICAVNAPSYGQMRKDMLLDIATLCGATFFSSTFNTDIEKATLEDLGMATKIVVTKDATTIVGGKGDSSAIEDRINLIKGQLENEESESNKDSLKKRLAKLDGGVCVLYISGDTDVEIKELKDRIEDTLASVHASIKDGIVLGGGVTLLTVGENLEVPSDLTDDEKVGFNIVKKALQEPIRQLAENSGLSADVVVAETLAKTNGKNGFNFATTEWDDNLFDVVVDPTLVETSALENANSVVGLLLNTGVAVTEIVKDNACKCGTPMPQRMM